MIIRDSKQQRQNANAENCIIPHCSIFIFIFSMQAMIHKYDLIGFQRSMNHFQFFSISRLHIFIHSKNVEFILLFCVQHIGLKIIMVFLGPWTDSTNFLLYVAIDMYSQGRISSSAFKTPFNLIHSFLLFIIYSQQYEFAFSYTFPGRGHVIIIL